MNDFKPGMGRRQQEAILGGLLAQHGATKGKVCPECGAGTDVNKLKAHPGCTGQTCRACGWESSTPEYKMLPNGVVIRLDAVVPGDVR